MLLFFAGVTAFLSLLGFYTVRSLFLPLEHWRSFRGALVLLIVVAAPIWPISRLLYQYGAPFWNPSVYSLAYLFLGSLSFIIPFLAAVDLFSWWRGRRSAHLSARIANPSRRRFLQRGKQLGAVALASPLLVKGGQAAFAPPTITHNSFSLKDHHSDLENLRIVQLSDLHIGPVLQHSWVVDLVEQVKGLAPDILVITGDLLDGPVDLVGKFIHPFRQIKPAHGKFFVTGNHEFYSGVDEWVAFLRREGFTVLNNEHQLVQYGGAKLLVAGVWDYHANHFPEGHQSSPAAAYQNAPEHDLSLLLAHQPRSVSEAAGVGFDLQLSGHTHGGQFWPWTLAVHLAQPYVYGAFKIGSCQLFVSSGTGFWGPPLRLGTRQEIVVHTFAKV